MTAAEILRSAQPPSDDGLIEKAIAELDVKLFEWTDALKSAHAQLRTAFAVKPSSARPSQVLYEGVAASAAPTAPPAMSALPASSSSLSAAAAAAHMPTPPTPPQWSTSPVVEETPAWAGAQSATPAWSPPPAAPAWNPSAPSASHDAQGAEWAQPQNPSQFGGHGISSSPQQPAGSMAWPTAPSGNWPESPQQPSSGSQQWPTWNPTDTSQSSPKKSSVRASRAPKAVRQTLTEGPTPEERAPRAAAEEALLSGLEDAIARRVRLLRRLDPDTAIEKLIDKARQGHAEAMAAQPQQTKDDKSSWWRRK